MKQETEHNSTVNDQEFFSLLPIGSVVKLKNVDKPVMIFGRQQMELSSKNLYDYVAVPYPEGNLGPDFNVFFDRPIIEKVLFTGYETEEELQFREQLEKEIEMARKQSESDE